MDTDRNLLFGVLALRANLLDAAQFAEVCKEWGTRKEVPLAELLVERGWLTPAEREVLESDLEPDPKDLGSSSTLTAGGDLGGEPALRTSLDLLSPPTGPSTSGGPEAPATAPFVPPTRARYTLKRLHGAGGIGRVWLAHDDHLGRDVALKELRPEYARSPAHRARFLQEARVTGQLEHPAIVPVYELTERPGGGQPFYAMRFVQGRTLSAAAADYHGTRQANRADALALAALLNAFVGVCNAVAFAHARGVVHRDLKGPNVVLGEFGEVVLLDWGLAKVLGRAEEEAGARDIPLGRDGEETRTVEGQVMGTPAYLAPEQAAGQVDRIGPRTDVYGLGAILYEILTGRPPFSGADVKEILRRVRQEEPALPRALWPSVPQALEAICLRALAKDPADRYPSAMELAAEVQRWLAGEPVRAWREPWRVRARRWLGRHRTAMSAAAAAALVALVSLAAATGLLAAANTRERSARAEAEENFRQARRAVDQYFTTVSEDQRLQEHDLRALRRQLLQAAVEFHRQFVSQRRDDPGLRAELGHAYLRLGQLTAETDAAPRAVAFYRQAVEVFETLRGQDPDAEDLQQDLAKAYHGLGWLYANTGRPGEAEPLFLNALAIAERLRQAKSADPGRRRGEAEALLQLSAFYQKSSRVEKAEDPARRAVELCEALYGEDSEDYESQNALVKSRTALGDIYVLQNDPRRWREAAQQFAKALDIQKKLAERYPAVPDYQVQLANLHRQLANMHRTFSHFDKAEAEFRKGIEVQEKLVEEHGTVLSYRAQLAHLHDNFGILYQLKNQFPEAEEHCRIAMKLRERLFKEDRADLIHACYFGVSQRQMGELKFDRGEHAAAYDWFTRSIKTLQGVLDQDKQHRLARTNLHIAYVWRTDALTALGRHAEALKDWDRIFGELDVPSVVRSDNRMARAECLARNGDHGGATAEAEQLVRQASLGSHSPGRLLLRAATVHGLSAEAARRDDNLGEAERSRLAEAYAARGVALLRQAKQATLAELKALQKNKDLTLLCAHEDFKKLLAEVEVAARPDAGPK
jgi:serine/threonine-protein kinase